MKTIVISEGNIFIKGEFDKTFENDKYIVHFNTQTGLEVLKGKDGTDPFVTDLPLLIDVGIMGSCLNACPFCYQGLHDEPHMTLENFKSIIDQVKDHTNQVALGGRGDPNLHPNFKEIVEYARDNMVVPNYTTSGINLTDDQIEISKMCGAVAVSDYEKDFTYDALNRLMDAGIKTNIHFIFSNPNFEKSINMLAGIDVWDGKIDIEKLNAVVFLLFKPQGSGKYRVDLIPTRDQIKTFSGMVFTPYSKFKIGMDSCLINHVLEFANPNHIQRMAIDTCESSRMSAYISPSMKLVPCSFADHSEYGIEMTPKYGIEFLWQNSFSFERFRKRLKRNPNCCPVGL
jgi:MoaA/NifB/PqqE/SkfB family radical SAM enzyme